MFNSLTDLRMLPPITQKHRVFVTFHHDDELYRQEFDQRFSDHFQSSSVDLGDIDPSNSDEHIKRLIQQEHVVNASVVFALYGANTYKRKFVDWEISAALSRKVGNYKGLAILLLPTFPASPFDMNGNYNESLIYPYLHPRTAANLQSGYADLYFWPGMYPSFETATMPEIIRNAYEKRDTHAELIVNNHPQYTNNLP